MTDPKGNSKFCFPETLNVSQAVSQVLLYLPTQNYRKLEQIKLLKFTYVSKELRSVLFSSSKLCGNFCSLQNSYKVLTAFCDALFVDLELLLRINFFLCSDLKAFRGHDGEKIIFLTRLDTNLPRIQDARPDHVRVESSGCCFPWELVSFVCPRELDCFDPCHVTRSCSIKKAVWVGRYNNVQSTLFITDTIGTKIW